MTTLRDNLPKEACSCEYEGQSFQRFLDIEVIEKIDGRDVPWIGSHKNVINWYKLDNGYAVGWNENPSIGWSFPVKKFESTPKG